MLLRSVVKNDALQIQAKHNLDLPLSQVDVSIGVGPISDAVHAAPQDFEVPRR